MQNLYFPEGFLVTTMGETHPEYDISMLLRSLLSASFLIMSCKAYNSIIVALFYWLYILFQQNLLFYQLSFPSEFSKKFSFYPMAFFELVLIILSKYGAGLFRSGCLFSLFFVRIKILKNTWL